MKEENKKKPCTFDGISYQMESLKTMCEENRIRIDFVAENEFALSFMQKCLILQLLDITHSNGWLARVLSVRCELFIHNIKWLFFFLLCFLLSMLFCWLFSSFMMIHNVVSLAGIYLFLVFLSLSLSFHPMYYCDLVFERYLEFGSQFEGFSSFMHVCKSDLAHKIKWIRLSKIPHCVCACVLVFAVFILFGFLLFHLLFLCFFFFELIRWWDANAPKKKHTYTTTIYI